MHKTVYSILLTENCILDEKEAAPIAKKSTRN